MYATCTICHRTLGGNESIEKFPVGRRLAFDAAKGRLWVVCTHCRQWNLSPLEERWEAIDGAEHLFSAAKTRYSTDNIGLARLRDGTELIRVGAPLRPEMAAWRYGSAFLSRRRSLATGAGIGAIALAAGALALPPAALIAVASGGLGFAALGAQMIRMGGKVAFLGRFILDNEHQYVLVGAKSLSEVRVVPHHTGWALRVSYQSRRPSLEHRWSDIVDLGGMGSVTITGSKATVAARQLLPLINGFGAGAPTVDDAVSLASEWSTSAEGFSYCLARTRAIAARQLFGDVGSLAQLPRPMRLALEMSLHEDQEARALDGDLADLERAWREAEIVAGISDNLLIPGSITNKLDRFRERI